MRLSNKILQILHSILGERYVYKFVCDLNALFQMSLAENHRTALKMEANCNAAASAGSGSKSAEYYGFSADDLLLELAAAMQFASIFKAVLWFSASAI